MNNFFATVASLAFITGSSAAFAGDFDNNTIGLQMFSGSMDYSIDADKNGLTELEIGYTAFEYVIGEDIYSDVRFALSTDISQPDNVTLLGQYNVSKYITDDLLAYGTAEVGYTTVSSFSNGVWYVEPTVGAAYAFTDTVAVYGEVAYAWDMSNSFNTIGGSVEIGLPISINESFIVTPSVSKAFDTNSDDMNFRLETTLFF